MDMKQKALRVVKQMDRRFVTSTESETGQKAVCTLVMRELGEPKYANQYVCTVWGPLAEADFEEDQLVVCDLSFSCREAANGKYYQNITASNFEIL